ncbi:MAG: chaperone modulatory protein CbpM [Candidatus Azotimanducaceae bacterium]|jgi:chaperone modulatory protein CbpM
MAKPEIHYFSFEDLCDVTELTSHVVIEVVEHGIVEPRGNDPASWVFDVDMITVTKKAVRLHQDLGIDWTGIALAINLLDEVESLRVENEKLKRRLERFVSE